MTSEHPNIPCPVCLDLWPLVCDGVASEESRQLVEAHLAACPRCRAATAKSGPLPPPPADDSRALRAVRRWLLAGGLLAAGLGCLVGLLFTHSANMFYNLLLLPLVGAVAALVLGRRWFWAPLGCGGLTYLWLFLRGGWELLGAASGGRGLGENLALLFISPFWMALIYSLLCLAGAAIVRLLVYACRRDPPAGTNRPGGAS